MGATSGAVARTKVRDSMDIVQQAHAHPVPGRDTTPSFSAQDLLSLGNKYAIFCARIDSGNGNQYQLEARDTMAVDASRAEASLATACTRVEDVTVPVVGNAAGADGGCRGGSSHGRGLQDISVSDPC